MPNRLADERSPYLLQHAGNPVDWYPWGAEAFEAAHRQDRPIFLSIGYSTCHWCHVMEHESFESREIAEALNRDFVAIKVDREERPDVDRVYMTFVQATTGSGGWPMSVFLTPSLRPFFGGTYFPPSARWGRPGFIEILSEIARVWRDERSRVEEAASTLTERLAGLTGQVRPAGSEHAPRPAPVGAVAPPEALDEAVRQYAQAFDARHGGFGGAPKFPRPSELLLLLREHARTGAGAPLEMTLRTLHAMAHGGIRDHVGGGFHRYSVDAEWRVPHFEKMLYDQAQLALAFLEAGQASGDRFFSDVAEDTLDYVRREMTDPAGGFYSAEDADSVPPELAAAPQARKREGAFYLWTDDEIAALVGEDADIARKRFGVEPGGNALHDPQQEFGRGNILYLSQSIDDISRRTGHPTGEIAAALERIRERLSAARAARPRPHLDDKILTAWNGLMIAAFARAARVLPDALARARALDAAQRAAAFLRERMWDGQARLLRRYRGGDAAIEGYCEDYGCLIWGLLELFQADGRPRWLDWALQLREQQNDLFWDDGDGGWFSTTGRDASVLLRLKEEYDGAEPAASSVSALNELTIAHLTDVADAASKVERTLGRYGPRLGEAARALPLMLCALSAWHAGIGQTVIVGDPERPDTEALRAAAAARYTPFSIQIPVVPGESQALLAVRLPFVAPLTQRDGRATAYVCRDFTCRQPATDPADLARELAEAAFREKRPPRWQDR
jgi:uncharacterized protein YyaL (SSP411 family)